MRLLLSLLVTSLCCLVSISLPQPSEAQTAFAEWGTDGPPRFYSRSRRVVRSSRRRATRARRHDRRVVRRSAERRTKRRVRETSLPRRHGAAGPMQVVVSLRKQKLSVYESGRLIATSRVSTGKVGSRTPTGVFSIIQKKRRHYSNIYYGASMPYMQRLTWSGIALHQGIVPGYPASHGCIRIPGKFARDLYRYTRRRNHVIVVDDDTRPRQVVHHALFQPTALSEDNNPRMANLPQQFVRLAMLETDGKKSKSDAPTISGILPQRMFVQAPTVARTTAVGSAKNAYNQVDNLELANERLTRRATRSRAPLRILIATWSKRDHVREAQRQLADLGYNPGPADGRVGEGTLTAIKTFQNDHGLTVTGNPNQQLYLKLGEVAGHPPHSHGTLRVRQNGKEIYTAHVRLKSPEKRIGTHLYTVAKMDSSAGTARWTGLTVSRTQVAMSQALDRIAVPPHVRLLVEDLLTPGSSLIITDGRHDRETGNDTDFIVLTD
jgi:lipoprotein-anchoring transpeptidase ErfK/SrfK